MRLGGLSRHVRILSNAPRFAGLAVTLQWYLLRLAQKRRWNFRQNWLVRPRQTVNPLTVETKATSDLMVFEQIFIAEEYRCLRDLSDIRYVFDLGANVGFSSVYFLSCFPEASILAVEPDPRNAAACRGNLSRYEGRFRLLQGAVFRECAHLSFSSNVFRDGLDWSRQVVPSEGTDGEVQAWDMTALMQLAGTDRIDLLKIDIERGELDVFNDTAQSWLKHVRNICIELHGPDCEKAFFSALSGFSYDLSRSGELTICRNLKFNDGARDRS